MNKTVTQILNHTIVLNRKRRHKKKRWFKAAIKWRDLSSIISKSRRIDSIYLNTEINHQ